MDKRMAGAATVERHRRRRLPEGRPRRRGPGRRQGLRRHPRRQGGDDTLYGGTQNDFVFGGWGDDVLHGDSGLATGRGDLGADRLSGGRGNDALWIGEGLDAANGGEGYDTFAFKFSNPQTPLAAGTGAAFAAIEDFNASDDTLAFDVPGLGTDCGGGELRGRQRRRERRRDHELLQRRGLRLQRRAGDRAHRPGLRQRRPRGAGGAGRGRGRLRPLLQHHGEHRKPAGGLGARHRHLHRALHGATTWRSSRPSASRRPTSSSSDGEAAHGAPGRCPMPGQPPRLGCRHCMRRDSDTA